MKPSHLERAKEYFAGKFTPPRDAPPDFAARDLQFHKCHDDWYRDYYTKNRYYHSNGRQKTDPVVAILEVAIAAFHTTYGHMPLCYKNCAISSGTRPHRDAVFRDHHTTDHLGRVVGEDWHLHNNILPNSTRSLQRAAQVRHLLPSHYLVTPAAFEGTTRVFSGSGGRTLTGGQPFDGADYMSFWNVMIDSCTAFILDDPKRDMPSKALVMKEIELAQLNSRNRRPGQDITTSDWANSRNSVLEMYRGNVVRFGLHPLRPDAKMDMWLYDDRGRHLSPATLLDCTVPVVQNILRWVPQGIAAQEACRTVARLFSLHRMRTDPEYNARQIVPLDLGRIDPVVGNPRRGEVAAMDRLIERFEPFLLKYCPHLIRAEGLPQAYAQAQADHPVKERDIGPKTVKWQRRNIPAEEVSRLWDLTVTMPRGPERDMRPPRPPASAAGLAAGSQRTHDLKGSPYDEKWNSALWEDNPYPRMCEMHQDMARMLVGVLETGLLPVENEDYFGVVHDAKRNARAQAEADRRGVSDLSLLPGRLGADFGDAVRTPGMERAWQEMGKIRTRAPVPGGAARHEAVFGTPVIAVINDAINDVYGRLPGPGRRPDPDLRLSLAMKMMDRNLTVASFHDGWETSEDSARLMLRATLIELGKVPRPFERQNDICPRRYGGYDGPGGGKGEYISFFERYDKLRAQVEKMTADQHIRALAQDCRANPQDPGQPLRQLEDKGIRHMTVALARLVEIYDHLTDEAYNDGTFSFHKIRRVEAFKDNIFGIGKTRNDTINLILDNWVWMWTEKDFEGLRTDYRRKWQEANSVQQRYAGPPAAWDRGITRRGAPS